MYPHPHPPDHGRETLMGGRIHILVQDDYGVREVPADQANISRQVRDLRAAGHDAYTVDDDEMIDLGRATRNAARNK